MAGCLVTFGVYVIVPAQFGNLILVFQGQRMSEPAFAGSLLAVR
jgi:hypothetical protein